MVLVGLAVTALVAGTYLASCLAVWLEWNSFGMPPTALPLRPAGVGGLVPGPIWTTDYLILTAPIGVALLWRAGGAGRPMAIAARWRRDARGAVRRRARRVGRGGGDPPRVAGPDDPRPRHGARRARAVAAAGITVAVVGIAFLLVTGRLDAQLRSIDEGRSTAIAAAVTIGGEHPITGRDRVHMGAFASASRPSRSIVSRCPMRTTCSPRCLRSSACIGLLALGVAAVAVGWAWYRRRSRRDAIATAAIVGLAGVHGTPDGRHGVHHPGDRRVCAGHRGDRARARGRASLHRSGTAAGRVQARWTRRAAGRRGRDSRRPDPLDPADGREVDRRRRLPQGRRRPRHGGHGRGREPGRRGVGRRAGPRPGARRPQRGPRDGR